MQLFRLICMIVIVLGCLVTAKNVEFTYYWTVFEEDFPAGSHYALESCSGGTLARVSGIFSEALRARCSGYLRSGEFVTGGNDDCSCYMKVSASLGVKGNPLQPYVSIAANDMPYGTKVFVRELAGIVLPNNKTHNGCVRVDDIGVGFGPDHIDFYVLRESNYNELSSRVDVEVDIKVSPDCVILSY